MRLENFNEDRDMGCKASSCEKESHLGGGECRDSARDVGFSFLFSFPYIA